LQGKSNLPNLIVPNKPLKPKVKIAYDRQGNYLGRISDDTEIQANWIIKEADDVRV